MHEEEREGMRVWVRMSGIGESEAGAVVLNSNVL